MALREWTILAPGPSLETWKEDEIIAPGPVIGLNSGVLSPLHTDFWCMQDDARQFVHVAETFDLPKKQKVIIWCREEYTDFWRNLGYRVWPHPDEETEFREEFWKNPIPVDYGSLSCFTLSVAVIRAIAYGAKDINIYGCDMDGKGYSFNAVDMRQRNDEVWRRRWETELTLFDRLLKLVNSVGVKLIRHKKNI